MRILLIAYAFPPSAEVGGSRIARFCSYLPEFGVQPVILTVQNRFQDQLDHTLLVPRATRVIRTVQQNTPLDWYATWKHRLIPSDSRKDDGRPKAQGSYSALLGRLRQNALSALSIPDQHWGWYFPAKRAGGQLLQTGEFDAILSTSPPSTAHLIGRSLKKKYQIPWIADFRDPWATDESVLTPLPKWRRDLDMRLEASCVGLADLVVCNTDFQNRLMRERYQKFAPERFVTLTNGFDDLEAPSNLELKKHRPLRCLHLGHIYEGRRIDTFCAALSMLTKKQMLDPDAVKVLFVGDTDESQIAACRQVASELMDSRMIEFLPRVNKDEAKRLLWGADLLLVFQGGYRAQIPLKFYEYLSTGKPIFAVSQEGALSNLMAQTGIGIWAAEDEPCKIGAKFHLALTVPANSPDATRQQWSERFHSRSLSCQLAKWIRELAHRHLT